MTKQMKQIIGAVLILGLIIIAGFKLGGMMRSQAHSSKETVVSSSQSQKQRSIRKKVNKNTTSNIVRKKVVTKEVNSNTLRVGTSWQTSDHMAINIESADHFTLVDPKHSGDDSQSYADRKSVV